MERRKFSRYPIECPVSIRLLEADVGGEIARGTTLNMASRGLLVATDQRLPQGASVEVAIEWPARLDERIGLRLVVRGSVPRCEPGRLAVLIRKHEFRLAGRNGAARL